MVLQTRQTTIADLCSLSEDAARDLLGRAIWPDGPKCAHCASKRVKYLNGKSTRPGLLKCYNCRKQFSMTTGTVLEGTKIPIRYWIYVLARMCASKKGVSSLQLSRELRITYKSVWFMTQRIRYALNLGAFAPKLSGTVEVDETYVGGRPKWYDFSKRGRGTKKTPVLAMVQRGGGVRTKVLSDTTGRTLKGAVRKNVDRSSRIFTDQHTSYLGIGKHFQRGHESVNHGRKEYVRGTVHTNTVESFFAILKRTYSTHHFFSRKHMHRYCDEMEFKWTNRFLDDVEKVNAALGRVAGRRLRYDKLIGSE